MITKKEPKRARNFTAKKLGKRMGKVVTEAQEKSGFLTTYLIEIFKNHKLIKIFQREKYENNRADKYIDALKEKEKKIGIVFVRSTPIMETLTGIMIAILIYYSGKLILNNEIGISNFFSFLAAMMLAYQPVRSLATLNLAVNQGISAAKRIKNTLLTIKIVFHLNCQKEMLNFLMLALNTTTKKVMF